MPSDPRPFPPRSRLLRGEVLLALFVVLATVVLFQQERERTVRAEARPVLPPLPGSPLPDGFAPDTYFLPADPMLGFVEIPEGAFTIGSDPDTDPGAWDNERWSAESAQGTVHLPAFHIQRFPVTVAQYRAFVEATGHPAATEVLAAPLDHPVTSVSWADAVAYAHWLDEELRRSGRTPEPLRRLLDGGSRVALPSEAEWEKAARGDDGRVFPWGDEFRPDRANVQSPGTTPVGRFPCPECPWDVRDLSGNVWEWTRSPFQPYPWSPDERPRDLEADALWVMRGGAFNDTPQNARAAVRGGADPGARRPFIGFRVVLTTF